jgi:hypothetical protein
LNLQPKEEKLNLRKEVKTKLSSESCIINITMSLNGMLMTKEMSLIVLFQTTTSRWKRDSFRNSKVIAVEVKSSLRALKMQMARISSMAD